MKNAEKITIEGKEGDELISQFEITFLIKEEDAEPVKAFLMKSGAKILNERPIVKVALEYPIKKQAQAFLGVINFEAKKDQIQKLTQDFNFDSGILRFLITKPSPVTNEARRERTDEGVDKEEREKQTEVSEKRRMKNDDFQLTNEALQRTIEEILQ